MEGMTDKLETVESLYDELNIIRMIDLYLSHSGKAVNSREVFMSVLLDNVTDKKKELIPILLSAGQYGKSTAALDQVCRRLREDCRQNNETFLNNCETLLSVLEDADEFIDALHSRLENDRYIEENIKNRLSEEPDRVKLFSKLLYRAVSDASNADIFVSRRLIGAAMLYNHSEPQRYGILRRFASNSEAACLMAGDYISNEGKKTGDIKKQREAIDIYLSNPTDWALYDVASVLRIIAQRYPKNDETVKAETDLIIKTVSHKTKDKLTAARKKYTEEQLEEEREVRSGKHNIYKMAYKILYYLSCALNKYDYIPAACTSIVNMIKKGEVFFADKAVEERVIKRMEETAEGDLNLNKLSSEATEKVNRLTVKDCGDPLALPGQKAPENGRVLSEREYGLLVKDTKFLSEFFPVHEYNARRLKYLEYKDGRRAYDFGSELEELRKAENDIASPDYKFYCRAFRKAVAADNNRNVAADIKPVVCGVAFGKGESFEAEAEVFPSYKEFFVNCSALLRGMADRFELISNDGYRIEISKGGITAVERIDEKNASLTLTAEELDAVAGKSLESALDISGQISTHTVTAENGTVTFVFEKIPEPRQEK